MSTTKSTAPQGDATKRNMAALKKKSYEIKFELDGTNYIPIENIGSGAYGVVCSAIHKKTNDKVAIKKTPNIFQHIQLATRTYREIKILRHFQHDNIISIREILTPNINDIKDVYIVLDLMESDLHKIIHTKQPLTNEHACYFLYQILRGLKYIHTANVIHRDLKPSNLLVNGNCDLKIGDFGMARGISSCVSETTDISLTQYVATRWYRAPELILSTVDYTAAVDVWSVGCIFAEMLGRKQLFPGSGQMDQLSLIVQKMGPPSKAFLDKCRDPGPCRNFIATMESKGPIPLQTLYPQASNKARNLLAQMLILDPDERLKVKDALKHPYLSKYHDPLDEPTCIPAFNFDFENEKMSNDALKQAILKEVDSFKMTSNINKIYNIKIIPKEGVTKATPTKSAENSATTPRTMAAIKQIQEIAGENRAKQREVKGGGGSLEQHPDQKPTLGAHDDQIVPQMPEGIPGRVHLKVASDKFTNDVEMISAKSRNLRIGSPPRDTHVKANVASADLKVESDKFTDDVEMISAKTSALRIESPPCDKHVEDDAASTAPSKVTLIPASVVTMLTPRLTNVDMPSAKWKEERTENVIDNLQAHDPPMDAKMALKAAILNGRKARSVSESEPSKPRVTAYQKQKEREDKRKKKQERASQRKKKQDKAPKDSLLLSNEDRNMLERWKTMQQTTKPFVHPIRSHMNDITILRQTESVTTRPGVGDHVIVGQPAHHIQHIQAGSSTLTAGPRLVQTQGMPNAKSVVGLPTTTVYNQVNSAVGQSTLTRSFSHDPSTRTHLIGTGEQNISFQGLSSQTSTPHGVAVVQVVPPGGGVLQPLPAVSAYHHQLGTMSHQLPPAQVTSSVPQHVTGNFQSVMAASQPIRVVPQPHAALQQQSIHQRQTTINVLQPDTMATQQMPASHPIGVTTRQISIPQAVGVGTTQISIPPPPHQTHSIPTTLPQPPSLPDNWGGMSMTNPVENMASVNLSSVLTYGDPGVHITRHTLQQWAPVSQGPTEATIESLPSYSEALQSKTMASAIPFYSQVSVEEGGSQTDGLFSQVPVFIDSSHSMTNNAQQEQQKDAVGGVTLSALMSKGMIDSPISGVNEWPGMKISPSPCCSDLSKGSINNNSLKVNTLTKMLQKSHVDDLTLTETPKGTGGGYGVGLDLDSLLLETLPMEADQSTRPPSATSAPMSAPLSASLLADWQDVSDMNPGELEALTRELEMGFPSPLITS